MCPTSLVLLLSCLSLVPAEFNIDDSVLFKVDFPGDNSQPGEERASGWTTLDFPEDNSQPGEERASGWTTLDFPGDNSQPGE